MKKNNNANEKEMSFFFDEEQDKKTAQSARMIAPYTDQEIEQLYNQPKLEPKQK